MRVFFEVIKSYLQDYALDTDFLIAKNKQGEPCIKAIQKKSGGKRLLDVEPTFTLELKEQWEKVKKYVDTKFLEVANDERIKNKGFEKVIRIVRADAIFGKNVLVSEKGDFVLVDLI